MSVVSISSAWLDQFSNDVFINGDMNALKKLGNLGRLYPELAVDCMQRLRDANMPQSWKLISEIGIAHESSARKAIEILANINLMSAQEGIFEVAKAHAFLVPDVIEILGRQNEGFSANYIGSLARANPKHAGLAIETLKVMGHPSAQFEIYSICKVAPEVMTVGIKALEFNGGMSAAGLMQDLAVNRKEHIGEAVDSILRLQYKFNEYAKENRDDLFALIARDMARKAQELQGLAHTP